MINILQINKLTASDIFCIFRLTPLMTLEVMGIFAFCDIRQRYKHENQ